MRAGAANTGAANTGAANNGGSRLTTNGSRTYQPSVKFFRLSQLRRLRGCEQVSAVCYRIASRGIEFLLVRTGSGHWTFPKGSAEPGLTHAQAAALEAFEEAGVHGRMEEASFTRYIRRKGAKTRTRSAEQSAIKEIAIQAHLCEVTRLDPPQERNRNPTWFSVNKAKRRLAEDRTPDYSAELARVIDRAITRIRRLRRQTITTTDRPQKGTMQKVQFIDRVRITTGRTKAVS
jgi:8-oxo-dGTP pyrophosphatase MutT (NUDIX family)